MSFSPIINKKNPMRIHFTAVVIFLWQGISDVRSCGWWICGKHEPVAPARRVDRPEGADLPASAWLAGPSHADPDPFLTPSRDEASTHASVASRSIRYISSDAHAYRFEAKAHDDTHHERHNTLAALHFCLAETGKHHLITRVQRDAVLHCSHRATDMRLPMGITYETWGLIDFAFLEALRRMTDDVRRASGKTLLVTHSLEDIFWLNDASRHGDIAFVLAKDMPDSAGPAVQFVRGLAHLERFSSLRNFEDLNTCLMLLTQACERNHAHSMWAIALILESMDLFYVPESTKKLALGLIQPLRSSGKKVVHIIDSTSSPLAAARSKDS